MWYTITKYVDADTGELLTTDTAKKQYRVIDKKSEVQHKKDLNGQQHHIQTITRICQRNDHRQLELFPTS